MNATSVFEENEAVWQEGFAELEKRKNIAEADDITQEDIERFITGIIEDIKKINSLCSNLYIVYSSYTGGIFCGGSFTGKMGKA